MYKINMMFDGQFRNVYSTWLYVLICYKEIYVILFYVG